MCVLMLKVTAFEQQQQSHHFFAALDCSKILHCRSHFATAFRLLQVLALKGCPKQEQPPAPIALTAVCSALMLQLVVTRRHIVCMLQALTYAEGFVRSAF